MSVRYLKNRPAPAPVWKPRRKIISRRDSAVIDVIDCGHDHPVGICPKCHRGHGLKIALSIPIIP